MEKFIKGDIVIIPFPFSDLSGAKKRPALVLSDLPGDDIILCQITSQNTTDKFAIGLSPDDFVSGALPSLSNIRPSRIFTADKNLILRKAGTVNKNIYNKVILTLVNLFEKDN